LIRSMTGFGAAALERDGLSVRVELRSVNHRHLQVKSRLPSELAHLEPELEGRLRKRLARGSVTVNVDLAHLDPAAELEIDERAAERYAHLARDLAKRLGMAQELSVKDLLGLPGVLHERNGVPSQAIGVRAVLEALELAIDALAAMREREGVSLAKDLARHAAAIERDTKKIGRRMPKVVREHHETLKLRVGELLQSQQIVSETDLARELALLADRLDVSEEISRLESHLAELRRLLDEGGSIGRQLDFLAQEFFREANTIGSKCNDSQVSHLVVDVKTHIERMREQVQNVE
jgi:uncharacterized protein (TIGR00255 family)